MAKGGQNQKSMLKTPPLVIIDPRPGGGGGGVRYQVADTGRVGQVNFWQGCNLVPKYLNAWSFAEIFGNQLVPGYLNSKNNKHGGIQRVSMTEKLSREKQFAKMSFLLFINDNKYLFSLAQNPGPPAMSY